MRTNERNTWILVTAIVLAGGGCTQSFRPDPSTETGNPPVIDSAKIALVVTRDEVHVRGEAGAIMPPEADVEVTIVRTRDATLDSVEDDGSFDVEVEATIDDVFEVRAVLGDLRSGAVIVDRGGAMVAGGNGGNGGNGGASGMGGAGSGGGGGTLSCDERTEQGRVALDEAIELADRSCEVDDDCMGFYRAASCVADCFAGFFSEDGLQTLRDAVQSVDDGVCSQFESDGCSVFAPPCFPPGAAYCVAGQCTEDNGGEICDACLESQVSWRVVDSGVLLIEPSLDVHTVSGCDQYARESTDGRCETTVSQCPGRTGEASIKELLSLVENEMAVLDALELGGTQGEPQETAGLSYEITIFGRSFVWRTCAGVQGVECLPQGPVERLIDVLTRLQSENTCALSAGDPCTSPWQDGDCDAAIPSWWHDPATGGCVGRIYGGCGGNANRHESFETCQTACPGPEAPSDCGEGRQLSEVCVECGVVGGCMKTQQVCALECDDNGDCMGELDAYGATATCNVSDGVCQMGVIGCI
jgi:hypothetical protein